MFLQNSFAPSINVFDVKAKLSISSGRRMCSLEFSNKFSGEIEKTGRRCKCTLLIRSEASQGHSAMRPHWVKAPVV